MILQLVLRWARSIGALVFAIVLSSCVSSPNVPLTAAPLAGNGYPARLGFSEPGKQEVVVVINYNMKMQHAGMFAGGTLLDPAGSYLNVRGRKDDWPGVSLQDYVRFQLEDGPDVRLYRFTLPPAQFARIKARVDKAGTTMPLFCAAKVQNIMSGVAPFESLPNTWLVSPARLADYLSEIIVMNVGTGECQWPNGASCYALQPGEVVDAAMQ